MAITYDKDGFILVDKGMAGIKSDTTKIIKLMGAGAVNAGKRRKAIANTTPTTPAKEVFKIAKATKRLSVDVEKLSNNIATTSKVAIKNSEVAVKSTNAAAKTAVKNSANKVVKIPTDAATNATNTANIVPTSNTLVKSNNVSEHDKSEGKKRGADGKFVSEDKGNGILKDIAKNFSMNDMSDVSGIDPLIDSMVEVRDMLKPLSFINKIFGVGYRALMKKMKRDEPLSKEEKKQNKKMNKLLMRILFSGKGGDGGGFLSSLFGGKKGKALMSFGKKALGIVGTVLGVGTLASKWGGMNDTEKSKGVGMLAGAAGGAVIGGAIGTAILPVFGTAIGVAIGGYFGGNAGEVVGEAALPYIKGWASSLTGYNLADKMYSLFRMTMSALLPAGLGGGIGGVYDYIKGKFSGDTSGYSTDNIYEQAQKAIKDGVKYGFGVRNSKLGAIDCSGWINEINKNMIDGLSDATEEQKKKGKSLFTGTASTITKNLSDSAGGHIRKDQMTAESLTDGMVIGEDWGDKKWDRGRWNGIDHIVQVIKDKAGKKMVTQSSGGKGVNNMSVEAYLKSRATSKVKLFGVDSAKAINKKSGIFSEKTSHSGGGGAMANFGIDAIKNATVNRLSNGKWASNNEAMNMLIAVESKGDAKAQRPNSQFQGLTQMGIAERKTYGVKDGYDARQSFNGAKKYAVQRSKGLKKAGIPLNALSLYLSHNQGERGFKNVWNNAKKGTPLTGTWGKRQMVNGKMKVVDGGSGDKGRMWNNNGYKKQTGQQFLDYWKNRLNSEHEHFAKNLGGGAFLNAKKIATKTNKIAYQSIKSTGKKVSIPKPAPKKVNGSKSDTVASASNNSDVGITQNVSDRDIAHAITGGLGRNT